MRFVEMLVATPLAQALGWTLLHSVWEGAILAAALAAALLGVRSARVRYVAACVALLVMLGGFSLTLVRLLPDGTHGVTTAGKATLPAWAVQTDVDAAGSLGPGLAAVVPWLAPFWIAGVWIFALGQVAGWLSVCRMRRRGVCCAPERWQKELARLSSQLRVSRPVLLMESCLADVPMVIGHIRPLILVPVGLLAGFPLGQVEAILLHELAHIRRCDYLVNVLQRSVECLLFYHPAVWWISRVIRSERENCCDDVAVATCANVQEYAVALASLEQNRGSRHEPALAGTGGNLMKRIRRLLYPQGANSFWTPLLAAAMLLTTAVAAVAAWPGKPPRQGSAAPPRQVSHSETSSYDRWLNQEVPYIITDTERAAFKKLSTDEEREKFIAQFWERRNPNPGSPENEFKKEHYERIAYANKHWGSNLPGWRTDRGRIYIVYGPPDEIESHPAGGRYDRPTSEGGGTAMTYPFEDWRYNHFEGVGSLTTEFVDVSSSGEFRMTLDPKLKYKKP